jgi:hypothetical protein
MTKNLSNQDKLAKRLDTIIPPGRSTPLQEGKTPLVRAALHLGDAPYPILAADKKQQMLAQVLAAHQAQSVSGRPRQLTTTQQALAAIAGVVLVAALVAFIVAPAVSSWLDSPTASPIPPITETLTNTPTPTVTDTPTATPTDSNTPSPEITEDENNSKDFGCEKPGNYCNSEGTPGGGNNNNSNSENHP